MTIKSGYRWIIIGGFFLLSCHANKKENEGIFTKEELNINDLKAQKEHQDPDDELFVVEGKAVIFFVVSKKELEKLNRELGSAYRYETDILFNNFMRQAETFRKILAKYNIHSELARNKRFLIKLKNGQTISFNRVREDQIMGEIITDGQKEPLIEFGMFTNKDLIALIKDYYKLKNIDSPDKQKPLIIPETKINIDSISE